MFYLRFFVEIESFSLKVNIPLLGRQIAVRPFRVFHALLNLFNIYFFARSLIIPKWDTILNSIRITGAYLMIVLNLVDFQMACFGTDDLSSSEHLEDRVLLGLYGVKYILHLSTTCVIYLENQSALEAIHTLGKVLSATRVMNAVISKYLVTKQLKATRALAESAAFLDRVAKDIREVIRRDSEINRAYRVIAGTTAVCSYIRIMVFCYMSWIVVGKGEHIDAVFEEHKSASLIFYIAVCSPSVLLGLYCSFVTDEVSIV